MNIDDQNRRKTIISSGDDILEKHIRKGVKKASTGFLRSILTLSGSSALAQALGIFFMPILSRLFLPEAFGTAALFFSFAGVVGSIATLRYELTIVLPKEDAAAANILVLCFFNVILVTAISFLLVGFFGKDILKAFNGTALIPYRWLLPITVFIMGSSQALSYWNTRNKFYSCLGGARIAGSLLRILGLIGTGAVGLASGGNMIVVRLLGKAVPPIIYSFVLCRHDLNFILQKFGLVRVWAWAKKYQRFPLLDSWTVLMNTISIQIAVMILMKYFGPRVAGLYSQSLLLLWLPTSLIGASIGQVSFQRFADHYASGKDISDMVGKLYRHLFSLGFLPFAILIVVGPDLFRVVLGGNWIESGVYARMLAPWIFINFLYGPLSSINYVFEKQHANFIFNLTLLVGRFGALLFGVYVLKAGRLTVLSYGLFNLLIYLSMSIYLLRCARVSLGGMARHAFRTSLLSIPFLAILAACKWGFGFSAVVFLIIAVLLSLVYLSIIISRSRDLREFFGSIIRQGVTGRK